MANEPDEIPIQLRAGTTVVYRRHLNDYPAPTWVLRLYLSGKSRVDVAAAADGTEHLVTLTAAQTANLVPGPYEWVEVAEGAGGARYDVATGRLTILPDPRRIEAGDALSHDERMLEAIEARLEGRLESDMERYGIYGREVVKIPWAELRQAHGDYKTRVARARRPGKWGPTVNVEFTRP